MDGRVYYVDLAVTGVSFGCMYAMMAVGLTLVYGLLRILHIAHAAVFALGAYVTVMVANATGSIALGFSSRCARVTPLFGMAIYRLLYEPLLQLSALCADGRLRRPAHLHAGRASASCSASRA